MAASTATDNVLNASPETVHWGVFDAKLPPKLAIASGETVTIHCVSGGPEIIPEGDFDILPEHLAITARVPRPSGGGHILTGPVAVTGAMPGDVLEIRIKDISLRQNWGWNVIRPLAGTLPEDFHEQRLMNIPLDKQTGEGHLPWGLKLPLAPFFGVMGVAPPPNWGTISTIQPRNMGGNLDLKELTAGTTLYLPVFVPGANFSCGDGHAAQGDGEVCITAIETALSGTFEMHVRKDMTLDMPRVETPTHWIALGIDPILDNAAKQALRQAITLICEQTNLSREDAYTLCSIACDMRVTQTVNQNKGVHVMIAKSLLRTG